jgi:hypothetical protein
MPLLFLIWFLLVAQIIHKLADMTRERSGRKNISIPQTVRDIGEELVGLLHKSSFSQLLTDLILDARKRRASGEDKNLSELLAENRKLKEDLANWKSKYRYLYAEVKRQTGGQ